MHIEHIAFWVQDLEGMKDFYCQFFDLTPNEKYHNPTKQFTSYFLSFPTGARLELMHRPDVAEFVGPKGMLNGLTHLAISVGSKERVDTLTEAFRAAGYEISGEPRTTGDGYYESVILDPEGNPIEITG
ncbi:VOC family protein [Pontibacter sp. G13]|uniref:VOC family protein n=1 Tax=Pontibacter sp. G13 TaxID=3074898 RepID=UPI00288B6D03|nr:VOC family protein [Pontibacter sp. G13]WNJ17797.1 VOC family protein [Pontibacter sp. G13]